MGKVRRRGLTLPGPSFQRMRGRGRSIRFSCNNLLQLNQTVPPQAGVTQRLAAGAKRLTATVTTSMNTWFQTIPFPPSGPDRTTKSFEVSELTWAPQLTKSDRQRESSRVSNIAMNQPQPNNPLHGITLKAILEYLVAEYGWDRLGERINIHCFNCEPTINSSLKFLRKTAWARAKVERLYLDSLSFDERKGKNAPVDEASDLSNVWDRARRIE